MKLRNGPPTDETPTNSNNITTLRPKPHVVGAIRWTEFFPSASRYVAAAGMGVTLDARVPSDAQAMRAWLAYLTSIGGEGSRAVWFIRRALTCPGGSLSQWVAPCRMPSAFTGDPADDRRQCCTEGAA